MAELAERHPNFTWHLVLSEEAEHGAGLIKGLVHEATHDALLRDHPDILSCEFYLCGPPAMLSATRQLLNKLGVDETMVAYDDRSEEHTSELQSLMRISYAVFCLK